MRNKIEAKNALEGYCVNIKHTLNDSKLEGKISQAEKDTVLAKVNEI
jgi:L1 cell adhesion molecule like protein